MENKIRKITRQILLKEFYSNALVKEDVGQVVDDTERSIDKAKGINLAKQLNDEGESFNPNDKIRKDEKAMHLAFEILVDAFMKNNGYEYNLPNGTSFTVNQTNILNGVKQIFDPYTPDYKNLIRAKMSQSEWDTLMDSPQHTAGIVTPILGKLTDKNSRAKMQQYKGLEEIPENKTEDNLEYLIRKYFSEGHFDKKKNAKAKFSNTFLNFLRTNLSSKARSSLKDYRVSPKRQEQSVDKYEGDYAQNKLKATEYSASKSHKFENLTHILGKSAATIGNIIIQKGLLSNSPDKEAYFKIILKLSLEFPGAAGSKLRNNELSKIYNQTESKDYKELVDVIFDVVKAKGKNRDKTNREIYNDDFDLMWKTESKDLKRGARNVILSNLGSIKSDAESQGVIDAEALTPALLAFLLESPKKANELYKNISMDTQAKLRDVQSSDAILDPIQEPAAAAQNVEPKKKDIFADIFADADEEDPLGLNDFLEESDNLLTETENDDPNASLNDIFNLIEKHYEATLEQEKEENINEVRVVVRKTILNSLKDK